MRLGKRLVISRDESQREVEVLGRFNDEGYGGGPDHMHYVVAVTNEGDLVVVFDAEASYGRDDLEPSIHCSHSEAGCR